MYVNQLLITYSSPYKRYESRLSIFGLLTYVSIDNPVHEIEANKAYWKHNSRVFINRAWSQSNNTYHVMRLSYIKLWYWAMI